NPFAVFRLGPVAKRIKTAHRGGQQPMWDDQVNLPVPEGITKVGMQVFNEDQINRREELLGEGEVDIKTVLSTGEDDAYFPLTLKGQKAGDVCLELTFYPATVSD
ncbi:hypothetical protein CLU79DRAFT_710369, partial [Phycomyces nitens]